MTNFTINPFAAETIDGQRATDAACHILRFVADSAAIEDYLTGKSLFVAATEVNSDHLFELHPIKTWLTDVKRAHDLDAATSTFEFTVERDEFGPAKTQSTLSNGNLLRPPPRSFMTPLAGTDSAKHWGAILDTNYLADPFWPAIDALTDAVGETGMIMLMAVASKSSTASAPKTTNPRMRGPTLAVMADGTAVLASLEEARVAAPFAHPIPAGYTKTTSSNLMLKTVPTAKALPAQMPSANFSAQQPIVMMPNLFGYGIGASDTEEPRLRNWDDIQPLPIVFDPTDGAEMFGSPVSVGGLPKSAAVVKKDTWQMADDEAPPLADATMRTSLLRNPGLSSVAGELTFGSTIQQKMFTQAATQNGGSVITKSGIRLDIPANTLFINCIANPGSEGTDLALSFTTPAPIIATLPNGKRYTLTDAHIQNIGVLLDGTVVGFFQEPVTVSTVAGTIVLPARRQVTLYADGQMDLDSLPENLTLHLVQPQIPLFQSYISRPPQNETLVALRQVDGYLERGQKNPAAIEVYTPDLIVYPDGAIETTLAKPFAGFAAGTRIIVLADGSVIDADNMQ